MKDERTNMKLHQLSNGNWIDLKTVTAITILQPSGDIPYRLVVNHLNAPQYWEVQTFDDAIKQRDELATLVNKAQPTTY